MVNFMAHKDNPDDQIYKADPATPSEDREMLVRACLLMCARRLRAYEGINRLKLEGPLSVVERLEAGQAADADAELADMAEDLFRPQATDSVAKNPNPV